MEKIELEIFEPDGKLRLSNDMIVFGSWGLLAFILGIIGISPKSGFGIFLIVSTFLLYLYYAISSFWSYETLKGTLKGEIVFNDKSIIINDSTYELEKLTNLKFSLNDYYGKRIWQFHSVNPNHSQGVNNYVAFTDSANQTHTVYFKLADEYQYESLTSFMNAATRASKNAV